MFKKLKSGTKQLIIEEQNGVIRLLLNNPKYKNALSEELTPYLREILKKIERDSKYKLLILKGVGQSFCSGGNIKGMKNNGLDKKRISEALKISRLVKKQKELTGLIYNLKIPTIAIITGAAAGAGFSLALSCDLRIGNTKAFFISNYSKIGLSGDYGISWFLTKLVGESKAKEIMFLNERIYAKEAKKLGILNIVIEKNFEKEIQNIINNILEQSDLALKRIKSNINIASNQTLEKSLIQEAKHLIETAKSKEHKLAIRNFKKNNSR